MSIHINLRGLAGRLLPLVLADWICAQQNLFFWQHNTTLFNHVQIHDSFCLATSEKRKDTKHQRSWRYTLSLIGIGTLAFLSFIYGHETNILSNYHLDLLLIILGWAPLLVGRVWCFSFGIRNTDVL